MDAISPVRKRTVRLKAGALSPEVLAAHGWSSVSEAARALGLSPSTLTRVINWSIVPGPTVIAALLDGTRRSFTTLFEIVDAE